MSTFKPLIVSLDLEFNQPSGRIIQIGAVVGDLSTGKVLAEFSYFVNPLESLAPEIAMLCGIAPGVLELGGTLIEAYSDLLSWLAPFSKERQLNPLTWGGGDSLELKHQLGLDERWAFGRRWVDVKTVFAAVQHARSRHPEGGLKVAMRKVNLSFIGRPHDARDDARNTFFMYHKLLDVIRSGAGAA